MKRGSFRADHERLALGDDPAVARDDVHHAAPDHLAPDLRRRHAERLRLRAASSASPRAPTRRSSSRLRCSTGSRSVSPSTPAASTRRPGRSSPSVARCSSMRPRGRSSRRPTSCSPPSRPRRRSLRRSRPTRPLGIVGVPAARAGRTAAPGRRLVRGSTIRQHGRRTAQPAPRSLEQLAARRRSAGRRSRSRRPTTLADDLARRVGIERDEMRGAVRDTVASWRAEAERLGSVPVGTPRTRRSSGSASCDARRPTISRFASRSSSTACGCSRSRPSSTNRGAVDGDNVTMETARPQRRIGRLSEIGRVATRHGFGYLIDRRRSNDDTQLADRGRRLREMLDELGPTFVKFGQLLSTRPDVMPPDIVAELRSLQDDVTPIPFADVAAGRRGGARAHDRAGVPLLRRDADRGRLDRPGAPGDVADGRRRWSSRCSARRRRARSSRISS